METGSAQDFPTSGMRQSLSRYIKVVPRFDPLFMALRDPAPQRKRALEIFVRALRLAEVTLKEIQR